MTLEEMAISLRAVADAIEQIPDAKLANFPKSMLRGEAGVGAAGMLCYIRDLFTVAGKDVFAREEILVILEAISRDQEIFPGAIGVLMWDAESVE